MPDSPCPYCGHLNSNLSNEDCPSKPVPHGAMSIEEALTIANKHGRVCRVPQSWRTGEDLLREAILVLAEELSKPGDECPT